MSLNGKYCIYKYIYNNEIVYIGKSKLLDDRISQHNKEIYFWGLNEIYYFICDNKEAMDINEAYYISKYRPPMNQKYEPFNEKHINLIIKEPKWERYNYNYEFQMPFIKEFSQNIIIDKFINDFTNKENYNYGELFGDKIIGDTIVCCHYRGVDFILFDEFMNYSKKIEKQFDQAVGKQSARIMNDLISMHPEGIGYIDYNSDDNSYKVIKTYKK